MPLFLVHAQPDLRQAKGSNQRSNSSSISRTPTECTRYSYGLSRTIGMRKGDEGALNLDLPRFRLWLDWEVLSFCFFSPGQKNHSAGRTPIRRAQAACIFSSCAGLLATRKGVASPPTVARWWKTCSAEIGGAFLGVPSLWFERERKTNKKQPAFFLGGSPQKRHPN